MKTISDAIDERLSRRRNIKRMDASDRVDAVYRKYPELAKIDSDLVGVRTSRMICAVEHDKEPLPALEKREKDLLEQRQKFLVV